MVRIIMNAGISFIKGGRIDHGRCVLFKIFCLEEHQQTGRIVRDVEQQSAFELAVLAVGPENGASAAVESGQFALGVAEINFELESGAGRTRSRFEDTFRSQEILLPRSDLDPLIQARGIGPAENDLPLVFRKFQSPVGKPAVLDHGPSRGGLFVVELLQGGIGQQIGAFLRFHDAFRGGDGRQGIIKRLTGLGIKGFPGLARGIGKLPPGAAFTPGPGIFIRGLHGQLQVPAEESGRTVFLLAVGQPVGIGFRGIEGKIRIQINGHGHTGLIEIFAAVFRRKHFGKILIKHLDRPVDIIEVSEPVTLVFHAVIDPGLRRQDIVDTVYEISGKMDRIRIFHIRGVERKPEEGEKSAFRECSENRFSELPAPFSRHGDAFFPGMAGDILEPPEFTGILFGIENQTFHSGLLGDPGENGEIIADAIPVRIGKPVDFAGLDAGGDEIVGQGRELRRLQVFHGFFEILIFEFSRTKHHPVVDGLVVFIHAGNEDPHAAVNGSGFFHQGNIFPDLFGTAVGPAGMDQFLALEFVRAAKHRNAEQSRNNR